MKNQMIVFDAVAPYPERVNIAELLNEIEAVIRRHVVLKDQAAAALAVWVLHTYTFELRDTVAYVAIESPEKRCGKTTLLSVLAAMAHKPLIASNVTVGALFRAIDTCRPALFIDEADTFLAGNGTMRGIINSGNTWRTAYVLRMVRGRQGGKADDQEYGCTKHLSRTSASQPALSHPDSESGRGEGSWQTATTGVASGRDLALEGSAVGYEPNGRDARATGSESGLKRYSCWCPKVIAMIGRVPDTIADRSIVVQMARKLVSESCAPLADLNATQIRAKCVRFALDAETAIAKAEKIRGVGLNDRAADTFDPLYVIARLAGGGWEEKLHAAARALSADGLAENGGSDIILDILSIFMFFNREKLFGEDLVYLLRKNLAGVTSATADYEKVDERQISQLLKPYGIKPSVVRIGKLVQRGYLETDFREALRRYVPDAEFDARVAELRERTKLQAEANAEARSEEKARVKMA